MVTLAQSHLLAQSSQVQKELEKFENQTNSSSTRESKKFCTYGRISLWMNTGWKPTCRIELCWKRSHSYPGLPKYELKSVYSKQEGTLQMHVRRRTVSDTSNSALPDGHLQYCNQFLGTPDQEKKKGEIHQKTTEIVMAQQHTACKERLRNLDLFSSGMKWLCSLQQLE